MKIDPNLTLLYVNEPTLSARLYQELLNQEPIELSPTFAMFSLKSGYRLGLWAKHEVEPMATMTGGGGELAFQVADNNAVDELHRTWQQRGLTILQAPTVMDFGYTFLALDFDKHRLRVFSRANAC